MDAAFFMEKFNGDSQVWKRAGKAVGYRGRSEDPERLRKAATKQNFAQVGSGLLEKRDSRLAKSPENNLASTADEEKRATDDCEGKTSPVTASAKQATFWVLRVSMPL